MTLGSNWGQKELSRCDFSVVEPGFLLPLCICSDIYIYCTLAEEGRDQIEMTRVS